VELPRVFGEVLQTFSGKRDPRGSRNHDGDFPLRAGIRHLTCTIVTTRIFNKENNKKNFIPLKSVTIFFSLKNITV
jgi:hypothetical protein